MITLFRRVRHGLIRSGRLRKYILYAIGEIALVVIGILIALQVNDWNEGRKIRNEEQELLASLLDELNYNKSETERSIEIAQMIQRKCEFLLDNTGDKGVKISKRESDSLIYTGLIRIISMDVSDGILSTLLNTGKIQIIQNDSLRILLSNWPSKLRDVKEDEGWAIDQRNNFIIPYLNKHYSSINKFNERTSGFSMSYKEIYQRLEFENIVNIQRAFYGGIERFYKNLLSSINVLIRLCEQELNYS